MTDFHGEGKFLLSRVWRLSLHECQDLSNILSRSRACNSRSGLFSVQSPALDRIVGIARQVDKGGRREGSAESSQGRRVDGRHGRLSQAVTPKLIELRAMEDRPEHLYSALTALDGRMG